MLHRDIRHRDGNRHHNKDSTAHNCPRSHISRKLIEHSVKNGKNEHHDDQPKYHVHIQPYFRTITVVAIERRPRCKEENIIDKKNEHKAKTVRQSADEHHFPFAPTLFTDTAIDANRI